MTTPKHTELPESQLLPCPFCGGGAEIAFLVIEATVKCLHCKTTIARYHSSQGDDGVAKAVKAWNTRYNQHAELIRQRDQLIEALEKVRRWMPASPVRQDEIAIKQIINQALTPTKEK